ncbi:M56 family metallopeptidase [Capnocytophaga cynodegmi]|uniref:Conserved putative Nucleoside-triphosphatase (Modular protein) n=1 Tax=Capnocytophaga cynodegmi TaxID=28189 RepID=A0A0B7HVG2_9FLAO|nr:M56 family metallopeptidase [Capnocytophaga cynodegmi]CEN41902.1 Conserved putative Nucleoside-triphosphatase (modular protein) [Capnocytophaga cynodegmi]
MIPYLIKTLLCGMCFYTLYHLLLSREKMLIFNRFFLLLALIASFVFPLITIEMPFQPVFEKTFEQTVVKQEIGNSSIYVNPTTEQFITENHNFTNLIIILLYGSVAFLMLFRFLRNLLKIFNKIKKHPKQPYQGAYLVILEEECAPHSFWNYIFINKKDAYEQKVLLHELTHIRQKHSLDLLFVEFLKIVFWFHPVVHLFGKAIRINHEFLADACVVSKHTNIAEYQMIILKRATSANVPFYNYFNFYNTKKRLIMLQTKVNHFRNLCKMALLIPTSVLFLVVFAEKSYAQEAEKQKEVSPLQASAKYKIIRVEGVSLKGKGEKTTVVLTDEAGNEIVEQITNNEDRQAFTKKYGLQLPPPPPPPPIPNEKPKRKWGSSENYDLISMWTWYSKKKEEIGLIVTLIDKKGNKIVETLKPDSKENRDAFAKKYGIILPPPPTSSPKK